MQIRRQMVRSPVLRDEESPPYEKKKEDTETRPESGYSVIATQEQDGKELVWLQNPS